MAVIQLRVVTLCTQPPFFLLLIFWTLGETFTTQSVVTVTQHRRRPFIFISPFLLYLLIFLGDDDDAMQHSHSNKLFVWFLPLIVATHYQISAREKVAHPFACWKPHTKTRPTEKRKEMQRFLSLINFRVV